MRGIILSDVDLKKEFGVELNKSMGEPEAVKF